MSTKIEWAGETWNPIIGCSPVSAGCKHCYARKFAKRLAGQGVDGYADVQGWDGTTRLIKSKLDKPLHWREPRRIFVCSMGDLFHESVSFEWVAAVFGVMVACLQHTFMLLTKRPRRMREFFEWLDENADNDPAITDPECTAEDIRWLSFERARQRNCYVAATNTLGYGLGPCVEEWPPPHIWLGVSVENYHTNWRISEALQIPATKYFVSIEPVLGDPSLRCVSHSRSNRGFMDALTGETEHDELVGKGYAAPPLPGLDLVIIGAETGPGARPMDLDWARLVRDQCMAAGVPFFFKRDSQGNRELDGVRHEKMPQIDHPGPFKQRTT